MDSPNYPAALFACFLSDLAALQSIRITLWL